MALPGIHGHHACISRSLHAIQCNSSGIPVSLYKYSVMFCLSPWCLNSLHVSLFPSLSLSHYHSPPSFFSLFYFPVVECDVTDCTQCSRPNVCISCEDDLVADSDTGNCLSTRESQTGTGSLSVGVIIGIGE